MIIKVVDKKPAPLINGVICYNDVKFKIRDKDAVKKAVFEDNRGIKIKNDDGKFVDAKDYFNDDLRAEKEVVEIESVEEPEDVEEDLEKANGEVEEDKKLTLEEIFTGHWMTQVKNAEENLETLEEFRDAIDYAYENDVSDAVIKRVKDMKTDLL